MTRRRKSSTPNKGWYILRLRGAATFLRELGLSGLACSVEEAGLNSINNKFSGGTQVAQTQKS